MVMVSTASVSSNRRLPSHPTMIIGQLWSQAAARSSFGSKEWPGRLAALEASWRCRFLPLDQPWEYMPPQARIGGSPADERLSVDSLGPKLLSDHCTVVIAGQERWRPDR